MRSFISAVLENLGTVTATKEQCSIPYEMSISGFLPKSSMWFGSSEFRRTHSTYITITRVAITSLKMCCYFQFFLFFWVPFCILDKNPLYTRETEWERVCLEKWFWIGDCWHQRIPTVFSLIDQMETTRVVTFEWRARIFGCERGEGWVDKWERLEDLSW